MEVVDAEDDDDDVVLIKSDMDQILGRVVVGGVLLRELRFGLEARGDGMPSLDV